MSRVFLVRPEAEADLAAAKQWYDEQREFLGDEFVAAVDETFATIQRLPGGGSEVIPGVRRALVRRFPYGVFYKVADDHLAIIAVYHLKRDPKGWQLRA